MIALFFAACSWTNAVPLPLASCDGYLGYGRDISIEACEQGERLDSEDPDVARIPLGWHQRIADLIADWDRPAAGTLTLEGGETVPLWIDVDLVEEEIRRELWSSADPRGCYDQVGFAFVISIDAGDTLQLQVETSGLARSAPNDLVIWHGMTRPEDIAHISALPDEDVTWLMLELGPDGCVGGRSGGWVGTLYWERYTSQSDMVTTFREPYGTFVAEAL